jgi:hypothetical protein
MRVYRCEDYPALLHLTSQPKRHRNREEHTGSIVRGRP